MLVIERDLIVTEFLSAHSRARQFEYFFVNVWNNLKDYKESYVSRKRQQVCLIFKSLSFHNNTMFSVKKGLPNAELVVVAY